MGLGTYKDIIDGVYIFAFKKYDNQWFLQITAFPNWSKKVTNKGKSIQRKRENAAVILVKYSAIVATCMRNFCLPKSYN